MPVAAEVSVQQTGFVTRQAPLRGAEALPEVTGRPAGETASDDAQDPYVPGALPRDAGGWPRTALKADKKPESELPPAIRRAEQRDVATAADTFPFIDTVYPESGSLVGSTTPLLTVRASRLGGPTIPMRYRYSLCEKPEKTDDDEVVFPPPPDPPCWNSSDMLGADTWRVTAGWLEWGKQYEWWVRVTDPESRATATSEKQLIGTQSPQPFNSPHLGEQLGDGKEFSLESGNYTTTVVDAQVQVAGPDLAVVRTYNSLDSRTDGMFGPGWSATWDMNIVAERAGSTITGLLVTYASGRRVRFAPKGDGTYQAPPGRKDTLADVEGGGWRLMDTYATTYVFNENGRLTRIEDNRGRAQTLSYNADGTFDTVSGPGGRALHFTWDGGRVATVSTDPVDGTAQTWTYSYTGGNLTSVCSPAAAPNCTTYAYGDGSRYKGLVLDAEPLGYWRLGDARNEPAANLGSEGGAGIYNNVTVGQPGALEGTADTAAGFTKSTMMLPWNMLDKAQNSVSIESWIKTSQNGIVLSAGEFGYEFGATEPVVYVGTDGKLRGQLGYVDGRYTPITSAGAVNDNQWHHVVLTVDGEKQKLYLDGQLVGELTGTRYDDYLADAYLGSGDRASSWRDIPGGQTTSGAFAFKGSIDEFAVYGKPLTEAEVQAHFAARAKVSHKLVKTTLPSGRVWASNTYHPSSDALQTHTDGDGGTWRIGDFDIDWLEGLYKVTLTDPRGETLQYAYDSLRNKRLAYTVDQAGGKTTYDYDTGGFAVKQTDPNGTVSQQWHDKRGNAIRIKTCRKSGDCQYVYRDYWWDKDKPLDPRNNLLTHVRDARSSSETDDRYLTTIEYNEYGEQVKQTTPATSDFPNGRSRTVTYTDGTEPAVGGGTTPAGLVKTETDYRGKATTHAYTAAGDHAEVRLPAGLVTRYTHDALGRMTSKTEVTEEHPDGVRTTYTYDAVGRLLSTRGPGIKNEVTDVTHTSEVTYTYDPDGNALTETASDLTGGDPRRAITYTYDDYGRVATVTGPEGGTVSYGHDAMGNQTHMVDELGNRFEYTYTQRGELHSTTLKGYTGSPVSPQPAKDVVLEELAYDPGGRLSLRTLPEGRKTEYVHYGDNLLHRVVAKGAELNGSTSTRDVVLEENTYDAAGNLVHVAAGGTPTQSASRIEEISYTVDAAGRVTSETFDPADLARKTAYVYDANGNVTKMTRTGAGTSRAESVEFAYNDDDVLVRRTVENGDEDVTTRWKVDERGLIVESVDPRGNASGADEAGFTTHYRHDAAGRLVEVKAPEVAVEEYGAEPRRARPSMKFGYDSGGRRTHEVDEAGAVTTSAYDRLGRLASITGFPYQQPGGPALTPKETFAYNPAGQVTRYTDPRGSTWVTEYDALGNRVRVTEPSVEGRAAGQWVYEYDLAGELRAAVDPTGARVESDYDDLGRMWRTTVLERKPAAEAFTTQLTYNDVGARTKEVGPLNRTTSWQVNAAGEITKETDPAGNATSYAYDPSGRATKVTDALGNSAISEYDLAGRLTALKEADSTGKVLRTTSYGYDAAGNEISETTPEGHTVRSTYDATDLLTKLVEPVSADKSITTTYGYDIAGSPTRATDGRGNAFWTTYNSLGLAERTIEPATTAHPEEANRTWTYVYDAGGNMISARYPGGVRVDHAYDALGRLTEQSGTGAEVDTPRWTFDYDAAGRNTVVGDYTLDYNDRGLLTRVAKGGTQTAAFTYDAYGNATKKQDVNGATTYGYDAADRLKTFSDAVSGRSLTYDYDAADRLRTLTSASPGGKQEFGYDDLDRITSHTLRNAAGSQLAKITYGWDKNDNLLSKVTAGTAGAGTNTYAYDQADRMTSWTAPDGTTTTYEWDDSGNRVKVGDTPFVYDERNRLLSGGGTEYTYTPRGTLATETTNGVTKQLTFDAFDNLVSDGDATYTYDGLGRLASRTQGGQEERFVYTGIENDIAAVTDPAGTVKARFGRDPDGRLVSLAENGVQLGVLSDQHDDVVATFTGDAVVDSSAYNPFGEVIASNGTKRRLGYQGAYTDPNTGKVNMASRWYVPGTGGFASRDDFSIDPYPSINLNRYTYAGGNPLAYTDPSGNCPFCIPILFAVVRVAAQVAIKQFAKAAVKQVVKQGVKQAVKKTAQTGGRKVTQQAAKKGTQQAGKKTAQQAGKKAGQKTAKKGGKPKKATKKKSTTRKQTARAGAKKPTRPVAKSPKVKTPKVKKPQTKTPKVKKPKAKTKKKTTKTTKKTTKKTASKPKTKTSTKKKNETANEATEMVLEEAEVADVATGGVEYDGVDYDGDLLCRSVISCAKDVVEELGENAAEDIADKVIEEVIDATIPDVPLDPPGTTCALPNSFVPGTPVLMADGSTKPIEKVETGDEVVATDPATGRTEARPVLTLISSKGVKKLVDITVTVDGAKDVITATDNHPFWVPKRKAWLTAGALQSGMWLQTSAGTYVQITAIAHRTATQRVHNLTVEDLHTYHVVAGSQAILVHNDRIKWPYYDPKKTAAYVDGIFTLSGYADTVPDGFERPSLEDVLKVQDSIGKGRVPDFRDNKAGAGAYYLSHAEKQAATLRPGEEVTVTRPMCDDCFDFFTDMARHTGQCLAVNDPSGRYQFKP
ncbi:polymorphic toxin-type HINT domain-containing protein [Nonomuraea salmonea]|uniref:Polymorphic toxin-type HINT domain-containing protein n=1 Tax=Nonomuraea salmonea TaxID=46181 RepID=A0ABV5NP88_9ACTN